MHLLLQPVTRLTDPNFRARQLKRNFGADVPFPITVDIINEISPGHKASPSQLNGNHRLFCWFSNDPRSKINPSLSARDSGKNGPATRRQRTAEQLNVQAFDVQGAMGEREDWLESHVID